MPTEILVTIAEVAAAFVGFSMVVGLLRPESPDAEVRFIAIRDVAEVGLIAIGGSLAPLAAGLFVVSEPVLWRVCSLGLSAVWLAGAWSGLMRYRKLAHPILQRDPVGASTIVALGAVGNMLLWWNVISPTGAMAGRYAVALLALLAVAGLVFVAATFRSGRGSTQ